MTTGNSDMTDKTGNSYTTGTTTNIVEITTTSQVYFWPQWARIKCPQLIVTMSDNRKWHTLRPLKPEILISLEPRQAGRQFQNVGFSATPNSRKLTRAIATTTDNRKWKHRRFEPEFAISGSRSLSKSFGYTFIELVIIENPEFVVGISRDITTSGLGAIWILPVVGRYYTHLSTLFSTSTGSSTTDLSLEFWLYLS